MPAFAVYKKNIYKYLTVFCGRSYWPVQKNMACYGWPATLNVLLVHGAMVERKLHLNTEVDFLSLCPLQLPVLPWPFTTLQWLPAVASLHR